MYIYIYIYRERERERETFQNIAHLSIVVAYHHVIKRPSIALTSVICLPMPYFYTLPHKGTFWKKVLKIKSVFLFSLLSLTESFTVRRVERDIIINEHMSPCNITVIIVKHSLKLNFHYRHLTNYQEIIFKKSVHWEPSSSILTNGKDEPSGRFSQIREGALKSIKNQIHLQNATIPITLHFP
jgi:hypothetical protein